MERLTTGRLLLRAFEPEDLQSLYAYCSEPDTGIHADKKPHESIEAAKPADARGFDLGNLR